MSNKFITPDEFIAQIFIWAWENEVDERAALYAAAGMGGEMCASDAKRMLIELDECAA